MKKRICLFFVLFNLFFSLATSCLAAPQDTIIGSWQGDMDSYLAEPDSKAELEKLNPEDREPFLLFLEGLYNSLKIEITKDTIVFDLGFPEKKTFEYTVIDSTDDSVTINIVGEETKMILQVVDQDHIKIYEEKENGEIILNYCLKK